VWKQDISGKFVASNFPQTEIPNLRRSHRSFRLGKNPGADLLAVLVVGDPDDLNVCDVWMKHEKLLNLARIDVLAAANEQVFDTTRNPLISSIIDCPKIADVHPSVGIDRFVGSLVISPITLHNVVASRADFSGFSPRHRQPVGSRNFYLEMGLYLAYGSQSLRDRIIPAGLKADGTRLRHPILRNA
jgi:hypothetical protein